MGHKQGILNLYKKKGETPLERINRFKDKNPNFKDVKFTYVGRLDPMAEGVLLVLYGEKIDDSIKKEYLSLDKEYIFDCLFGFETDTFDVLGEIKSFSDKIILDENFLVEKIKKFEGSCIQSYPMYSSKTVKGIPLFIWAKRGEKVDIPKRKIKIYSIERINDYKISKKELLEEVLKAVSIEGDFRQNEIKKSWQKALMDSNIKTYKVLSFKVVCSSGTYIRVLANEFGKSVGVPALALNILRTKVGDFNIKKSILD